MKTDMTTALSVGITRKSTTKLLSPKQSRSHIANNHWKNPKIIMLDIFMPPFSLDNTQANSIENQSK